MGRKRYDITLGARSLLHEGYHGALYSSPPPGVTYNVKSPLFCYHTYYKREQSFSPFKQYSVCESQYYTGRHSFIHSAHYPVANPDIPWIVDTDALELYLRIGHVALSPHVAEWQKKALPKRLMLERIERMLELYCSDHCLAICFHSKGQLLKYRNFCHNYLPSAFSPRVKNIFEKAVVCYPARAVGISLGALRKRNSSKIKKVVFAARAYEDKGGHLVLRLYRELMKRKDVQCIYVGQIPDSAGKEYHDVLSKIKYAPSMSQERLFELFRNSHLFVMPTKHEALGIIFSEAMSCGLPIITSSGPGMRSVEEVIHDGKGGFLLHKNSSANDVNYTMLKRKTIELIEDCSLQQQMSEYNWLLIREGEFSLKERNRTLLPYYRAALRTSIFFSFIKIMRAGLTPTGVGAPNLYVRKEKQIEHEKRSFQMRHYPPTKSAFVIKPIDLSKVKQTRAYNKSKASNVLAALTRR